jgi:hypothetical protein
VPQLHHDVIAWFGGNEMNKLVRKALTSGIFLIIGIVLVYLAYSQFFFYLFSGPLGVLSIIIGVAYWLYIWPDELPSGKEIADVDLAIGTDESNDSTQSRDLENITQSGFYHGVDHRGYFGGVDRRPPSDDHSPRRIR